MLSIARVYSKHLEHQFDSHIQFRIEPLDSLDSPRPPKTCSRLILPMFQRFGCSTGRDVGDQSHKHINE